MRALMIEAANAPLVVKELEIPRRGQGEALIRMETASLNPVEAHIWAGRFFEGPPQVPYVPGAEGVGVVVEGDDLAPGIRVRVEVIHPGYGWNGVLAEYVVAPESPNADIRASQIAASPLPDGVEGVAGVALGVPGFTAVMLIDRAEQAGASFVGAHVGILAGTGAVGLCLVQMCKVLGAAHVVAIGRDSARLKRAQELGADATVELNDQPQELTERLLGASGGRLDVVFDPLWGETGVAAINALSPGGVYVNFGQVTGATAPLPSIPLRNKRISLVGLSGALATPAERREAYERAHALAAGGRVVLDVEEISLEQVPEAWARLSNTSGSKIVVRIASG
jgi:NADPH:quinone reductase